MASQRTPIDLPTPPPLTEEMRNQAPVKPPPNLPNPADLMEQLRQLQELIAMSPEKLVKLRQSIEFIEKMSPEEREAMRIRLAQVTQLNRSLDAEVQNLHAIAPDLRESDLAQFWIASSEEQREATRSSLESLQNDKDKAEFLHKKVEAFIERRETTLSKMRERLQNAKDSQRN